MSEREIERAAVVAWLRDKQKWWNDCAKVFGGRKTESGRESLDLAAEHERIAAAIEAGEHLGETA